MPRKKITRRKIDPTKCQGIMKPDLISELGKSKALLPPKFRKTANDLRIISLDKQIGVLQEKKEKLMEKAKRFDKERKRYLALRQLVREMDPARPIILSPPEEEVDDGNITEQLDSSDEEEEDWASLYPDPRNVFKSVPDTFFELPLPGCFPDPGGINNPAYLY